MIQGTDNKGRLEMKPVNAAPGMSPKGEQNNRLYQACIQFEAMLVQQMLTAMQSSTPMFGNGFGGSFYQGLFEEEMAKDVAQKSTGLADTLYAQMIKLNVKNNPGENGE